MNFFTYLPNESDKSGFIALLAPKARTFSRGEGAEGSEATEADVEFGQKVNETGAFSDLLSGIDFKKSILCMLSSRPSRIPHPSRLSAVHLLPGRRQGGYAAPISSTS